MSKMTIQLIECFNLGFFGLDRCCMGSTCSGIIKGILFGGSGIWACVDNWYMLASSLSEYTYADALGLQVVWTPDSLGGAKLCAIFMLIEIIIAFCGVGVCFAVFGTAAMTGFCCAGAAKLGGKPGNNKGRTQPVDE